MNANISTSKFEIIVPCFNPVKGWELGMCNFIETYKDAYSFSIIFVNDGSTVNNPESNITSISSKYAVEILFINIPTNLGKGAAIRKGVEACKTNRMIYTDVDFPFENDAIINVIKSLDSGNDIVFGFREKTYYQKVPFFRKLISKVFRSVIKLTIPQKNVDTQCGLKGFNERGKKIFMAVKTNRYLFDFEFIKLACKAKLVKIDSVNVKLKKNIIFSSLPLKVLIKEFGNFIRIMCINKKVNVD